jgi:hypothetical protein
VKAGAACAPLQGLTPLAIDGRPSGAEDESPEAAMSFRAYIIYCALYGGCAALIGWALGRFINLTDDVIQTALRGLVAGLMIALTLALIDGMWNFSTARVPEVLLRMLTAAAVGCVAGFLGGMIGGGLYKAKEWPAFLVLGWTLTGLLIGAALGVFDLFARMLKNEESRGARRKVINGLIGGGLGGLLGGVLSQLFQWLWELIVNGVGSSLKAYELWSPGATGFVALGMLIGLLIGLAQVILREAWVKVEAGFRPGRELMLEKEEVVIGRAEGSDVALFGDPQVEKVHARIVRKADRYLLIDEDTPGGTFLNGRRVAAPMPLRSGDLIRVGKCSLRFGERQKRSD